MSLLAETFVRVGVDPSGVGRGFASLRGPLVAQATGVGRAAGAALSSAFVAGATGGIAALVGGAWLAKVTVGMASEAEESAAKFSEVFKKAGPAAGDQLDAFAAAAGRSRNELRSMAADVQALLLPMLGSEHAAADLSVSIVKLASDLSSFNNVGEGEALTALRAALVGETEPARRLGINLSAARVEAQALAMGFKKVGDQLAPAAKIQATMAIITKDAAAATGDAIRTSGSYANTLRAVQGSMTDLGVEIGQLFLPAASELNKFLRSGIEYLRQNTTQFAAWGQTIGEITRNVLVQVGEFSKRMADSFGAGFNDAIAKLTGGGASSFGDLITQLLDKAALLTSDFSKTWELVQAGGELAATTLSKAFIDGVRSIRDGFVGMFNSLPDFVKDFAGAALDGVNSIANGVREALANIAKGFDALMDTVEQKFNKIIKQFKPALSLAGISISGSGGKGPSAADAVRNAMVAKLSTPIDIRGMGASFGGGLDNISAALGGKQSELMGRIGGLFAGMTAARDERNKAAAPAQQPQMPDFSGVLSFMTAGAQRLSKLMPKFSEADQNRALTKAMAATKSTMPGGAAVGASLFGGRLGEMIASASGQAARLTGMAGGALAEQIKPQGAPPRVEFHGFEELSRSVQTRVGVKKDEATKKTAQNTSDLLKETRDLVAWFKSKSTVAIGLAKGSG